MGGWSNCNVCSEGYKSNEDNTGCDICPAGTYSPSNSAVCYECPKGTFSNRGYSSCTPCPEGYYGDTEGASECKRCPHNTNSYLASTFCFECPKEGYCSGPIENKDDIPERYNKDTKVKEDAEHNKLAKLFTKRIFGKTIEFNKYSEFKFDIPGYTVTVTLFDQIIYELKGDIQIKFVNGEVKSIQSNSWFAKNTMQLLENLENALSGQINFNYNSFMRKIGDTVSSADVHISYNFFKNAVEITIISKLQQGIGENDFGIKYSITPRFDLGYVYQIVASKIVELEVPDLHYSIIGMTFEQIKEFLRVSNRYILNTLIPVALSYALCCLIILVL